MQKVKFMSILYIYLIVAYLVHLEDALSFYMFRLFWKPSVMGSHLEEAASFGKSSQSTLSISDSVCVNTVAFVTH